MAALLETLRSLSVSIKSDDKKMEGQETGCAISWMVKCRARSIAA